MSQLVFLTLLSQATAVLFVFAYGACIGSLCNVLVYRLPRGMGVVTPASRCPSCGTKLTFRENIPVFGWILLRGKCRFCKSRISPEYPIVETVGGLLFVLIYLLFYGLPALKGIDAGTALFQPEWAANGLLLTWPQLLVIYVLFGSLIAITLIDARTAQIPLVLVWVPALVGLVMHTANAAWVEFRLGNPTIPKPGVGWLLGNSHAWFTAPGELWSIMTPGLAGWEWVGLAIGGTAGLGVAMMMLKFGLLRRSFADYDEWEKQALAERQAEDATVTETSAVGDAVETAQTPREPPEGEVVESRPDAAPIDEASASDAELWIQYPHARREMLKEIAFLAPPVAMGAFGFWLAPVLIAHFYGPPHLSPTFRALPAAEIPLWLSVLSGVLMGMLIGGAVVWAIRILGSLAFGKEALGLGDVHLVAAIGACLGWADAVLGFFGAAFVGLAWTLMGAVVSGKMGRTLPYGPYIAIATFLVVIGKPGVEWILTRISGAPVNLP